MSDKEELVAVYIPRRGFSLKHLKCCVVVFQGRELVVVSARANIEPLLALGSERLPWHERLSSLALR